MDKKKQKWISDKIGKLIKEGKPKEEAASIAYIQYQTMLKGGKMSKYQSGGLQEVPSNPFGYEGELPFSYNPNYQYIQDSTTNPNIPWSLNPALGNMVNTSKQTGITSQPVMPTTEPSINIDPNQIVPAGYPTEEELEMSDLAKKQADVDSINNTLPSNTGKTLEQNIASENAKSQANYDDEMNAELIGKKEPYRDNVAQMFNPFGSIGLDQAIAYAGEGFGEKDGLKALAGTSLATLKGARTFMSNFARAKENRRRDKEYTNDMREEPKYAYAQEGGQVMHDKAMYEKFKDSTGIEFTEEGFNKIDPKIVDKGLPSFELGRYKDLNYFDVQRMGDNYIVRPSGDNRKSADQYKEDLHYLQDLNPNVKIEGMQNLQYYVPLEKRKQGGKITNGEQLTGQYLTEDMTNANVELEDGEYTENSQTQQIQEVVGEKHDNGGVKTNLPDQSKVISDYTKIGKTNAKFFKDQLSVKIKASDTYATVMDKYNKNIGLDDIITEEEELYKKIESQVNDKDMKENVRDLNMSALQKKLSNLQERKKAIEEQQKQAFDTIFEKQEAAPKKKEEAKMTYGGVMNQDIKFLAKKYGIEEPRLLELMQEGGVYTNRKRLEDFYNEAVKLGYEGDFDFDAEDMGAEVGKLQQYFAENHPEKITKYFEKQPITAKGVDLIKRNHPEMFEKAGIPKSKKPADYTNEERMKLQQVYKDSEFNNQEFWTTQFVDNVWNVDNVDTWRFPFSGSETKRNLEPKGLDIQAQVPDLSNGVRKPSDFYETAEEAAISEEENVMADVSEDARGRGSGVPFIPIDFILPPSARRPVYKQQIALGRLDPIKATAEPNLVELERQRQTIEEMASQLPPAQRAALIANSLSQTQGATNEAIGQVTEGNSQRQFQADVYNLNADAKEQIMNANFAQDYEAKTMAAITNNERDIRQYFNDLNDQQRYNFEYIDRRNLLNQAFPQYNVWGSSDIEFAGAPDMTYISPFLSGKKIEDMTPEEANAEQARRLYNMKYGK